MTWKCFGGSCQVVWQNLMQQILIFPGVNGQCSTPPINQVVYQGAENVFMTCNSPTMVSWVNSPTDDFRNYKLTIGAAIAAKYTPLYAVNSTGLTIKTAQTSPLTPPLTTSGLYTIAAANATYFGARLTVVRK